MQPQRPAAPQPQWQMPSPAYLAAGVNPNPPAATVRGVSANPPAAPKFVLPSPEALGVTTSASAPPAAKAEVDWNQIQARMERLGVLQYKKTLLPAGVQVMMLLPTSDPRLGQPVEAHAATEAAAVVMALDAAEAWARKR